MDWTDWLAHFERNRTRPLPDLSDPGVPEPWRELVVSTLARLQAGETGEGRIVNQVRQAGLGDAVYQDCVRLFVAEEGRHAAILGRALKALGGGPRPEAWTARLFTLGRHAVGPRAKLLVLLSAEVIAIGLYGAMGRALPDGSLREAFLAIERDEVDHLAFHCDLLRTDARARALFRVGWRALAAASAAVVLADHAPTLKVLGICRRDLARDMLRWVREAETRVMEPHPSTRAAA